MPAPRNALQKPYRVAPGSAGKVPRHPQCPHCSGLPNLLRLYYQVPVVEKGKTKYTTSKSPYKICPRCERVYADAPTAVTPEPEGGER